MIVPFEFELHVADDLTDVERGEARVYAQDSDKLGVDEYICERMVNVPFAEVLAHLLMFAPAWLFGRRWVAGWTVDPVKDPR